jgi:hypothetical protein
MKQEQLKQFKKWYGASGNVMQLIKEVERLQLVFAFHCDIGNLSISQVATALNMSKAEVTDLMKKLPERKG